MLASASVFYYIDVLIAVNCDRDFCAPYILATEYGLGLPRTDSGSKRLGSAFNSEHTARAVSAERITGLSFGPLDKCVCEERPRDVRVSQ